MSGDNDSVDRPEDLQNLDQPASKLTMTLSKCLMVLVVAHLVLGLVVWLVASAFKADLGVLFIGDDRWAFVFEVSEGRGFSVATFGGGNDFPDIDSYGFLGLGLQNT